MGEDIAELRAIKDEVEIKCIEKAGEKAKRAIEKALDNAKLGISETEIAAEAYDVLYKMGSEEPLVYVNAGPNPRVHAEPLSTVRVKDGTTVTIVIAADHLRYYANKSETVLVGSRSGIALNAMETMGKVHSLAAELTEPGVKLIDVMKEIDRVYAERKLIDLRVVGYTHGVGLLIEEPR